MPPRKSCLTLVSSHNNSRHTSISTKKPVQRESHFDKCPICGNKILREELDAHAGGHTTGGDVSRGNRTQQRRQFNCTEYLSTFSSDENRNQHLATHFSRRLVCQYCGFVAIPQQGSPDMHRCMIKTDHWHVQFVTLDFSFKISYANTQRTSIKDGVLLKLIINWLII